MINPQSPAPLPVLRKALSFEDRRRVGFNRKRKNLLNGEI